MTGLCLGRVVVTLNPQLSSTQWEVAPEKGEELEMSAESPCELQEPEPSPFSSKRTMYETEEVRSQTPWVSWKPLGGYGLGRPTKISFFHHLGSMGSEAPQPAGPVIEDTSGDNSQGLEPSFGKIRTLSHQPLSSCVHSSGPSH